MCKDLYHTFQRRFLTDQRVIYRTERLEKNARKRQQNETRRTTSRKRACFRLIFFKSKLSKSVEIQDQRIERRELLWSIESKGCPLRNKCKKKTPKRPFRDLSVYAVPFTGDAPEQRFERRNRYIIVLKPGDIRGCGITLGLQPSTWKNAYFKISRKTPFFTAYLKETRTFSLNQRMWSLNWTDVTLHTNYIFPKHAWWTWRILFFSR